MYCEYFGNSLVCVYNMYVYAYVCMYACMFVYVYIYMYMIHIYDIYDMIYIYMYMIHLDDIHDMIYVYMIWYIFMLLNIVVRKMWITKYM